MWATGVSQLREKKRKNRVTTRQQTETFVRLFSEVMWFGPTTQKTIDSKQLLWAISFIHLKREKLKKSSDDAATDGDPGASVLRDDVAWPENVKDDIQRATAAGN